MLYLDKYANKVIERILAVGVGLTAFRINNEPDTFLPLSVEVLHDVHIPALGLCKHLSLTHYKELNGDLMRDPEMCFLQTPHGPRFAFYFRNDYTGTETSALCRESKTLNASLIRDMNEFACIWMRNLAEQQHLTPVSLTA